MSGVEASFHLPQTVIQAAKLRQKFKEKALVIAGGTTTVPLINKKIIEASEIIALEKLPLRYVKKRGKGVEIGALSSVADLQTSPDVPVALRKAAASIHGLALKESATIGGNIFTPAPGGDLATALLSIDAKVVLQGAKRKRIVPLSNFFRGPMQFSMRRDEILTSILIDKPPTHSNFIKQTIWRFSGPTIASVAIGADHDGKLKRLFIAVGGLTPHPYRATNSEKILLGSTEITEELLEKSASYLSDDVEVAGTAMFSADYLGHLAKVLFKRAFSELKFA